MLLSLAWQTDTDTASISGRGAISADAFRLHPSTASSRVPFEHIGRARDFWRRVAADDRAFAFAVIEAERPIRRRLERHPRPRFDNLVELRRSWLSMPSTGRLVPLDAVIDNREIRIIDIRASAISMRYDRWQNEDTEPALMLSIISTWIGEPSRLERLILHRASVSLHALGRWFQRIGPRANDDLLRCALAPLAQADQQEVLRADGTFAIEATGGVWLGEKVHDTAGVITLAARTFRD